MPFDFFKDNYISINNFDGALHYPFVFDFKGINALLGAHTVDVLLSGVSPLTLLNAVKLNYVKAFGKCEQDGTPTPTSPVDIVCNNGTLKVRHQSGLPIGYQLYEYITASGNQWLDTGIKLASTDIVEVEFQNSSTTGYGALYGVFAMGDSSAFYANGTYYGYDVANGKVDTNVSVNTAWHTLRFDYTNGIITLDGNNTTYTPFVFDNAKNNYLFSRYYGGSYGYGFKGSCKRYKVIRNNEVICDLIPAKSSFSNAIGMYDLANDVFHGNVGSGDFTATNPIDDLEVYYDGTVETVQAHGKNLFDANLTLSGGYINSSGAFIASGALKVTPFIEIKPNTTYTISGTGNVKALSYDRYAYTYTAEQTPIEQIPSQTGGASVTFTTAQNAKYIRIQMTTDAVNTCQLELGSTATTYEPYFEGNTVTCQPLLSVGDYKDIQNITSGAITRNVGIKVLDGTETWVNIDQYSRTSIQITNMKNSTSPRTLTAYCNYFENLHNQEPIGNITAGQFYLAAPQRVYFHISQSTTSEWQAWLAQQYAAGTPVIVVYPLATSTTETVTGQTLTITQGTNVVTAEGSVDGLELEISYKGYAELTVEEIEAVNTDESVDVTIS